MTHPEQTTRIATFRRLVPVFAAAAIVLAAACHPGGERSRSAPADGATARAAAPATSACDNAGLTLPDGFCATVFADSIGHARHLAVGPDGTLYANTWSGRYYGNDQPHAGGFLVALRDTSMGGSGGWLTPARVGRQSRDELGRSRRTPPSQLGQARRARPRIRRSLRRAFTRTRARNPEARAPHRLARLR
jgi:hypothetical protein